VHAVRADDGTDSVAVRADDGTDSVAAVAHHYAQAGSAADPGRALAAAVAAAAQAEARYAHGTAAELYQQAVDALDRLPPGSRNGTDEARLDLLRRRITALLWSDASVAANRLTEQALELAERVAARTGSRQWSIAVLSALDVSLPWLTRDYEVRHDRRVAVLDEVLSAGTGTEPLDPATRCRLLRVLARELGPGDPEDRARPAAEQAVALARTLGDPEQLAGSLGVVISTVVAEFDPDLKLQIARELQQLGDAHGLPTAQVLARSCLVQLAMVRTDLAEALRHAEAAAGLAERYQLAQAATTALMARATIAHARGQLAEAAELHQVAATAARRHGAVDADRIALLGEVALRTTRGGLAELEPVARVLYQQLGATAADLLALCLLDAGRDAEAAEVFRTGDRPRADYLYVLRLAYQAKAAVGVRAADRAEELIEELRPFAGQLGGAGNASFTVGPIAQDLGDLALLAGRPEQAREFYVTALDVALTCGNPVWIGAAERALAGVRATSDPSR
jgi:hypothetical protein